MTTLSGLVGALGLPPSTPLTLAICTGAGRVEAMASGTWRNGRHVQLTDRFYTASLAKQVTGAAAALLVREGRLDPDRPVSRYVAALPAWASTITPRQLAHHVAGLPAAGVFESETEHWTQEFAMAVLNRLPHLEASPGSAFGYSNLGYVLLAQVISTVAGGDFATFVDRRLFAPLGLAEMAFAGSSIERHPQAVLMGPSLPKTTGDGGLWSTASAFSRWLHHQNRDTLGIGDLVTEPPTLTTGAVVPYGWGLGLRSHEGRALFRHGGEWTGATAMAVRHPSTGLAVAAMSSGAPIEALGTLVDAIVADWPDVGVKQRRGER